MALLHQHELLLNILCFLLLQILFRIWMEDYRVPKNQSRFSSTKKTPLKKNAAFASNLAKKYKIKFHEDAVDRYDDTVLATDLLVSDLTKFIRKNHPRIDLVPGRNAETVLQELAAGKTDAAVTNLAVATYVIDKFNLSNIKIAKMIGGDQYTDTALENAKELLVSHK